MANIFPRNNSISRMLLFLFIIFGIVDHSKLFNVNGIHFRYSKHIGDFVLVYKLRKGAQNLNAETPIHVLWKQFTKAERAKLNTRLKWQRGVSKFGDFVMRSEKKYVSDNGIIPSVSDDALELEHVARPGKSNALVCRDEEHCSHVFYHILPFNGLDRQATYEFRNDSSERISKFSHTFKYGLTNKICAFGDVGVYANNKTVLHSLLSTLQRSACDVILPFGFIGELGFDTSAGRVVVEAQFYNALWPALRHVPVLMPSDFDAEQSYDESAGKRFFHFMDESKVLMDLMPKLVDDAYEKMAWRNDLLFSYIYITPFTIVFHSREFFVLKSDNCEEQAGYLVEWLKSVCKLGSNNVIAVEQRVRQVNESFLDKCDLKKCLLAKEELDKALYKRADFVLRGDYDDYSKLYHQSLRENSLKRKHKKIFRVILPHIKNESRDSSFRRTQFIYSTISHKDEYGDATSVQNIAKLPEAFGFEGLLLDGVLVFSATSHKVQCRAVGTRKSLKAFQTLERITTSELLEFDKKTGARRENRIPGTGPITFEQITRNIRHPANPKNVQKVQFRLRDKATERTKLKYPDDLSLDGHLANVRRVFDNNAKTENQNLIYYRHYRRGLRDALAPLTGDDKNTLARSTARKGKRKNNTATRRTPRTRNLLDDEFDDDKNNENCHGIGGQNNDDQNNHADHVKNDLAKENSVKENLHTRNLSKEYTTNLNIVSDTKSTNEGQNIEAQSTNHRQRPTQKPKTRKEIPIGTMPNSTNHRNKNDQINETLQRQQNILQSEANSQKLSLDSMESVKPNNSAKVMNITAKAAKKKAVNGRRHNIKPNTDEKNISSKFEKSQTIRFISNSVKSKRNNSTRPTEKVGRQKSVGTINSIGSTVFVENELANSEQKESSLKVEPFKAKATTKGAPAKRRAKSSSLNSTSSNSSILSLKKRGKLLLKKIVPSKKKSPKINNKEIADTHKTATANINIKLSATTTGDLKPPKHSNSKIISQAAWRNSIPFEESPASATPRSKSPFQEALNGLKRMGNRNPTHGSSTESSTSKSTVASTLTSGLQYVKRKITKPSESRIENWLQESPKADEEMSAIDQNDGLGHIDDSTPPAHISGTFKAAQPKFRLPTNSNISLYYPGSLASDVPSFASTATTQYTPSSSSSGTVISGYV